MYIRSLSIFNILLWYLQTFLKSYYFDLVVPIIDLICRHEPICVLKLYKLTVMHKETTTHILVDTVFKTAVVTSLSKTNTFPSFLLSQWKQMKNKKISHCRNNSKIIYQNCRKEQNRYRSIQIHDAQCPGMVQALQ